ncbi:hypothetical protein CPB85DRAFT_1310675 [Mucidula mucida]|nr:hypothetical protein CPB85DRAFT_1310675 [Mucidula mucida]
MSFKIQFYQPPVPEPLDGEQGLEHSTAVSPEPARRGRPKGSKNCPREPPTPSATGTSSDAPKLGRPKGTGHRQRAQREAQAEREARGPSAYAISGLVYAYFCLLIPCTSLFTHLVQHVPGIGPGSAQ